MEVATCKWSVRVQYVVHVILILKGMWGWSLVLWKTAARQLTSSSPFELVDVEREFEGWAEFQAHVFHHHVTT